MVYEKFNNLKHWWLLNKRLPKTDRLGNLYCVEGDNVLVGNEVITETNHLVKIVGRHVSVLSWDFLVEYSNGALRWMNSEECYLFQQKE